MEELRHRNDIEIKLLPNRRFIYSNRRQNIVITAENKATEITVLFPEEYGNYSKRVDFVNSQGKEWTEGLYTPEYGNGHGRHRRNGGESNCRFHFTLPTEVTTPGELKMQFLAYLPDESMTTVPFEIITIDVQEGVLAFKKNARSNPDLLILSYNRSTEALFKSEQAKAKSIEANAKSDAAVTTSNEAKSVSENALAEAQTAVEKATENDGKITVLAGDLAAEVAARELADEATAQAIVAETTARSEALAQEAAERQAADKAEAATREANDNAETAARIASIEANAAALAAEVERAIAAENAIAQNALSGLQAEAVERQTADQTLQANLEAEAEARAATDQTLQQNIDLETARATAAEQVNAAAILAETDRATVRENAIEAALESEVIRAQNAELANAQATADEATARQNADTAEAGARQAGDSANAASILSENERAQLAEAGLQSQINAEKSRAQGAEAVLRDEIRGALSGAVGQANAYTDEAIEQVRIDGTIYKGTVFESELPTENQTNGDLYWISDFDLTRPEHTGSAIWNGQSLSWDFSVDNYKHEDNDTIVSRESDGALKVADTNEADLTADTADYGGMVTGGFKATLRGIFRKIKGLFVRTAENAEAITTETGRATVAESGLQSAIDTESARAVAAESATSEALSAEVARATQAEAENAQGIATESARANQAESANANAITDEAWRAQTAENNLQSEINQANMTAQNAEFSAQNAQQTADQAWQKVQDAEYLANDANYHAQQAEWAANDAQMQSQQAVFDAQDARQRADNAENAAFNADNNAQQAVQTADQAWQKAQAAEDAVITESTRAQTAENDLQIAIAAEQIRAQAAEDGKIDKIEGKGLSTEDYSTAEKIKLASLENGGGDYLPLAGGILMGNLTIKYPNKIIGSGNGQADADWMKYDNNSNFLHIGNTGTVPAINAAGSCFYRRNSAGASFKVYDEGNPPVTEIPLTFSNINSGISSISGHYVKESAEHGRLFIRLTCSATINYWTTLFKITNTDIPKGIGNRLGICTTMGASSFNGSSLYSVCSRSTTTSNDTEVMCSSNLSATWDYTITISI